MRAGRLSAVSLMEACLDRIATLDGALKAFVCTDPPAGMQAAAQADRAASHGPLHGLPFAVKDVLDTADMETAYGTPIWSGYRPKADASCVALARAAGAIVIGKTVTTEFATRKAGPTVNPRDPAHTPGGSSSGSAAAVAAHLCPVAFGTQTAGSIIRPAAFCGIVGYKPSFGLMHRAGMKVMSESLDTIGLMARSVADCALFVGAMTKRDLGDPETPPSGPPRVAVSLGPGPAPDAETAALLETTAQSLARAGAAVRHVDLPVEAHAAYTAQATVMNIEIAQAIAWELATARDQLSAEILQPVEWALAQPASALDAGRRAFRVARAAFADWMSDFDMLLTPSAPGEAPAGLSYTGDAAFNLLWSALHVPCVTVPAGSGLNKLPLGVQIVTRVGQDREALVWARWVQAAIG